MARDLDATKIRKWAATGDRVDPDDSRISPRLNRAKGWPASFSARLAAMSHGGKCSIRFLLKSRVCSMKLISGGGFLNIAT